MGVSVVSFEQPMLLVSHEQASFASPIYKLRGMADCEAAFSIPHTKTPRTLRFGVLFELESGGLRKDINKATVCLEPVIYLQRTMPPALAK